MRIGHYKQPVGDNKTEYGALYPLLVVGYGTTPTTYSINNVVEGYTLAHTSTGVSRFTSAADAYAFARSFKNDENNPSFRRLPYPANVTQAPALVGHYKDGVVIRLT